MFDSAPAVVRRCLLVALIFGFNFMFWSGRVSAEPDDYHEWLTQQLETDFDLTGGTWLLGDNEFETLNSAWIQAQDSAIVTIDEQPFNYALHTTMTELPPVMWAEGIWLRTIAPVEEGDSVLVVLWARSLSAQIDDGLFFALFEERTAFAKSLHWPVKPSSSWQQIFIPAEIKHSTDTGQSHLALQLGTQLQSMQIAGIAAINYGPSVPVESLPLTPIDHYAGEEADAEWRTAAADRIAQHRTNTIDIEVLDANGNPLPAAEVAVQMQAHTYAWGTAVDVHNITDESPDNTIYREKLLNLDGAGHGFNTAVPENALKWIHWESDNRWWSRDTSVAAVGWLHEHGLDVRGHNLLWGNWPFMPPDIEANQDDPIYVRQRVDEHIVEMLTHEGLAGKISEWDMVNEARDNAQLAAIFAGLPGYTNGNEIYADWFNQAQTIAPDVAFYINDFNVLSNGAQMVSAQVGYKNIISDVIKHGGNIDGIGMQSHIFYPLGAPELVYETLDEFAEFGLPLRVTEFDIAIWDEAKAADYMRDFMTIVYSHPATTGFVMWDFWDGSHWKGNAPLFRDDWSLKPSGEVFVELLFDEWWTDEVAMTDEFGRIQTPAFHGEYTITANYFGVTQTVPLLLDGVDQTVTIQLPTQPKQLTNHIYLPLLSTVAE